MTLCKPNKCEDEDFLPLIFKYKHIYYIELKDVKIPKSTTKLYIYEYYEFVAFVVGKKLYIIEETKDINLEVITNHITKQFEGLVNLKLLYYTSRFYGENVVSNYISFPKNLKQFVTSFISTANKEQLEGIEYIQTHFEDEESIDIFPKSIKELVLINYDIEYLDDKEYVSVYKQEKREDYPSYVWENIIELFETTNLQEVHFVRASDEYDVDYFMGG